MTDDVSSPTAPDLLAQAKVDLPAAIRQWLHEWDQTKTGAAIDAVLGRHEHRLFNAYMRVIEDAAEAEYARCETCGNLPNGTLWCPTVAYIAAELGVSS